MAIIPQKQLFGWKEIENIGDLDRLRLVIEYLPDEKLMKILEKERGKGRDDFPVRPVWNTILAGVVFQHISIESLRRELQRNGQLRDICGLDLVKGLEAVPNPWAYSRFLKRLIEYQDEVDAMFNTLVDQLKLVLPDFGELLALDGKGIETHARERKVKDVEQKEPDGRRDTDADWGVKTYHGKREDGTLWEKVKSWFGYKLHLIVDANYELPLAFKVTKASEAEMPKAHDLLDEIQEQHPDILKRCDYLDADRGYDDGKLITRLWDSYEIKPVIDIRNMWKDGEDTKVIEGKWNIIYNYKGQVFCVCPKTGKTSEMAYGGFEKDRETLKYRCPAQHYGYECSGCSKCPVKKAVRIPLAEDRRIFTPLARSSFQWKSIYKKRTSVERVNSRLDVSFGFEEHFIRGLTKMKLRCSLALCVMLAMALGRIKENQPGLMRSLVKSA